MTPAITRTSTCLPQPAANLLSTRTATAHPTQTSGAAAPINILSPVARQTQLRTTSRRQYRVDAECQCMVDCHPDVDDGVGSCQRPKRCRPAIDYIAVPFVGRRKRR